MKEFKTADEKKADAAEAKAAVLASDKTDASKKAAAEAAAIKAELAAKEAADKAALPGATDADKAAAAKAAADAKEARGKTFTVTVVLSDFATELEAEEFLTQALLPFKNINVKLEATDAQAEADAKAAGDAQKKVDEANAAAAKAAKDSK